MLREITWFSILLFRQLVRYILYPCQACTQDFAQEGATCSRRGPQVTRGPPWRLGAQKTRGPRMTAEAHWVIRGPSGNQGYMNETLIYIFLPSKRFIHCLEKNIPGPEGPLEGAQGGALAPVAPLGYVTDTDSHVMSGKLCQNLQG